MRWARTERILQILRFYTLTNTKREEDTLTTHHHSVKGIDFSLRFRSLSLIFYVYGFPLFSCIRIYLFGDFISDFYLPLSFRR